MKIDADIRRAHTPDGAFYRDASIFAAMRERVFAPTWQLVTEPSLPSQRGHACPYTLLEGTLDEPLVFTYDGHTLRALSNVCTHRGNLVVTAPCEGPTLRCGYHGRRFELDGRLRSMPCFEDVVGFPSPADDLSTFAHATLGPLHFVSLDPAFTFEAWLHGLGDAIRSLPLDRLRHDPNASHVYTVRAHWMLYVENYLEGFHVPFVHPELNRTLAMDQYGVTLYDWSVVQTGYARSDQDPTVPFAHGDERVAAWYVFLFPNLMLNFYPWGLSVNVVEPVSLNETRVRYLAWTWHPALRAIGAGASLDEVEREDEAIVEAVQRGVSARRYRGGRYSPSHEKGLHHFHRLVAACLKGLSSENKGA